MSKITVYCGNCGDTLLKFPSLVSGRKYGNFCDNKCLGIFRSKKLTGEFSANYKNGFRKTRGYIEVEANWHPNKNKRGYVALHRLIAEAKIKRFLKSNEIVHHEDGDNRNNHFSNLKITTQSDHALTHVTDGTIKRNNKNGRFKV